MGCLWWYLFNCRAKSAPPAAVYFEDADSAVIAVKSDLSFRGPRDGMLLLDASSGGRTGRLRAACEIKVLLSGPVKIARAFYFFRHFARTSSCPFILLILIFRADIGTMKLFNLSRFAMLIVRLPRISLSCVMWGIYVIAISINAFTYRLCNLEILQTIEHRRKIISPTRTFHAAVMQLICFIFPKELSTAD